MAIQSSLTTDANVVRRIVLSINPIYVQDSTQTQMVTGLDKRGFQWEVLLDVLPPGVTVDMITAGQEWFIERRSTYNRLFQYCGQFTPHSQLRVSTTGLTLTNANVYTNVPFTNKISVQSGSCGVTVYSGGQFIVPIPGLYNVSWNTTVSNGGTTRLYSSTLSGYYPTGLIGSDILCLTSGSLKFSIQSKAPYAGSPTPLPGSVSSGGWVSVSYVGSVQ